MLISKRKKLFNKFKGANIKILPFTMKVRKLIKQLESGRKRKILDSLMA